MPQHSPSPSTNDPLLPAIPARRAVACLLGVLLVGFLIVSTLPAVGTATAGDSPVSVETAAIDAGPVGEAPAAVNASFGSDTYTTTAGDLAEVTVSVENGPKYLLVGGNRLSDSGGPVGFVDVVEVDGEGSVTLTLNTRVAGTGVDYVSVTSEEGSATSCAATGCSLDFVDEEGESVASGLGGLPSNTGADGTVRPLAPERYRLSLVDNATFTVGGDGTVAPAAESERSELVLTEPEHRVAEEVEVFTTMPADPDSDPEGIEPVGSLRSDGLERSAVTKGDRLVIGVEAAGIWGALSHLADEHEAGTVTAGENATGAVLGDLLAAEEGVFLEIEQTNPGRNSAPTRIGPDELEDATLIFESASELESAPDDPTAGRFYLVIDTSDGNAIGDRLDPGEEYRVEFGLDGADGERYRFAEDPDAVDADAPFAAASVGDDGVPEQFPYLSTDGTGVSVDSTFSVSERYLRYDHVTDDGEILVDGDGVTGTTTLLPATELTAVFAYDGGETPRTAESTVRIDDDGNFSIDPGIGEAQPGDRLTVDLYADSGPYDSRTAIVVADADEPDRLRLDDETTELNVTRGDTLSELSVTVRNAGVVENREPLSLEVAGGELYEERYVTVAPDEPRNETFDGTTVDLDPGTYSYTLAIDGDETTGTLTVEPDPAVTQIDDEAAGDDEADGNDGDDGSGTENGTEVSNGTEPGNEAGSTNGTETEDDTGNGGDAGAGNGTDGGGDTETANGTDAGEETDTANGTESGNGSDPDGNGGNAPDETDTSSTPALIPVGTREAFGGTVVVGATYLIGHWV
ncbi:MULTISPECIES: BGTF surface domain-containing protein [Haloferacaceae]|uniref:BGTF surface domain-containing protein n=1 Tax=Halorubrum glutamatedens TaxID=2707018 RepID=A0ABD5QTP0_9EURY|nr:BGTF surface domain-containing protein [Halobellus captivus]